MNGKYFAKEIPAVGEILPDDEQIFASVENAARNYIQLFKEVRFSQALEGLWEPIRLMNKYVDSQAPWTLYKENKLERSSSVRNSGCMQNLLTICFPAKFICGPAA